MAAARLLNGKGHHRFGSRTAEKTAAGGGDGWTERPAGATPGGATAASPPPGATVGQRWRFRRNLVIYVAHRQGLSQRLLADVFDLPRSRIGAIVQEFRRYDPDADGTGS